MKRFSTPLSRFPLNPFVVNKSGLTYDSLASAHQLAGNYEKAVRQAERALEISPTCMAAYCTIITSLAFLGESARAIKVYQVCQKVSPRDPDRSSSVMGVIMAYFIAHRHDEAISACLDHKRLRPNWYANRVYLAASAAFVNRKALADEAVRRLLEIQPGFTVASMLSRTKLRRPEDIDHLAKGLNLAGVPQE